MHFIAAVTATDAALLIVHRSDYNSCKSPAEVCNRQASSLGNVGRWVCSFLQD